MLFLLAARRAGLLAAPAIAAPGAEPPAIPKRICQFWDADPPPDVVEMMDSWRSGQPGHEYERFDNASAEAFIARHHNPAILAAFRRSSQPAQRADLFRLAWLAVRGGIYVDADDRWTRPLEQLIPPSARLVGYQEDLGTLANNFLGATPSHPVIVHGLRRAAEAINRGDAEMIWLLTGPGLVTRAFAEVAAADPAQLAPGASVIFELWHLSRFVGVHQPTHYKRTQRHWSRATFRPEAGASRSRRVVTAKLSVDA